jgi:hypothetical protein
MITGKAVAEVTEAEVKNLEKYLIIIPSIAAAFASTLIAITAVRRIKPPEPTPTIPDEAAAYLFGPLVAAIKTEARDAVAAAMMLASDVGPEQGSDGGRNRDHVRNGIAATRKSLGFLGVSKF